MARPGFSGGRGRRRFRRRADARITSLTIDGVRQTSSARARIYADRPECGKLKQDGTYKIAGRISEARYGAMPLWLTDVTTGGHVRPPNLPMRAIGMMQEAFFVQTARLSDQGKVLVPGLTLGVLGQDYVPAEGDGADIDSTYAAQVEDAFQRSGIVHLMAGSGGPAARAPALGGPAAPFGRGPPHWCVPSARSSFCRDDSPHCWSPCRTSCCRHACFRRIRYPARF